MKLKASTLLFIIILFVIAVVIIADGSSFFAFSVLVLFISLALLSEIRICPKADSNIASSYLLLSISRSFFLLLFLESDDSPDLLRLFTAF